eukprot:s2661_g13.t1
MVMRPSSALQRPRTARQRAIYSEVLLVEGKPGTQKLAGPSQSREFRSTREPRPLSANGFAQRKRHVPALMLEASPLTKYAVIEPKVIESHKTVSGRCPRRLRIERLKKKYESQDIQKLLIERGVDVTLPWYEDISPLPLSVFDNRDYDLRSPSEWLALAKDPETGEERNAVFPDDFSSPVIGILAVAASSSLDHLLLYPGNPLRFLAPALVDFATTFGPLICELTAGLAEADTAWVHENGPSMAEVEQAVDQIRSSMAAATSEMTQWRLNLPRGDGIRFDRLLFSVQLAIEELEYYDGFAPLRVIKENVSTYQIQMQQAIADHAPHLRGLHPAELDASQ